MAGKGDKQRPVDKDVFDENYEKIFGPWVPISKRAKNERGKRKRRNEKNLEQN
tara:strand:+ start:225 stop:383 length:159 start_codon:yes stop_codon:yes gene_type:complete